MLLLDKISTCPTPSLMSKCLSKLSCSIARLCILTTHAAKGLKSARARTVLRSLQPRSIAVAVPGQVWYVSSTPLRRAINDSSMRRQSSIMRSIVRSWRDYEFSDCHLRLSPGSLSGYEKSRSFEISSSTCCRSSSDTLPSSEGTSVRASSTVSQHNVPTSRH